MPFTGHCLPCRKSSGTTYSLNIIIPTSSLNITGSSSLKTWKRTGESGKEVTNSFCGTCGNLVLVNPDAFEGMTIVKYGLVDDQDVLDGMAPQREIYCKNFLQWERGLEGTEKKKEST